MLKVCDLELFWFLVCDKRLLMLAIVGRESLTVLFVPSDGGILQTLPFQEITGKLTCWSTQSLY